MSHAQEHYSSNYIWNYHTYGEKWTCWYWSHKMDQSPLNIFLSLLVINKSYQIRIHCDTLLSVGNFVEWIFVISQFREVKTAGMKLNNRKNL